LNQRTEQQNLFSTVTPKKVPEVVYKQLISLISSGRLKPGEKLPSERAMASEMSVSRQSVREAVHRAQSEGLIEVRQGGGTFVISSVRGTLKPPLSIILEEQAEKIFEFLEIRKLFEAWCAEKASSAAKASDLRKIEGFLRKMEKLEPGDVKWEKADLDFHSCIAAASHNLLAVHIMEGLKDSFNHYFRAKKFVLRSERKDALIEQHRNIFEAIKQRDAQEAKRKIIEHLEYVEEIIAQDLLKLTPKAAKSSSRAKDISTE
jgi:GntR family transcriptional regulator, transcriptional repressor for pyruvate dehydrogenase complex